MLRKISQSPAFKDAAGERVREHRLMAPDNYWGLTKEDIQLVFDTYNSDESLLQEYSEFKRATKYWVISNSSQHYSSKAVVAAAYTIKFPNKQKLSSHDINGGISKKKDAAQYLINLGFDIVNKNGMITINDKKEDDINNLFRQINTDKISYVMQESRKMQDAFRESLLKRYKCCVITGCEDIEALEAAHIIPYSITRDQSTDNGILIRADLHRLFDRKLVEIDSKGVVSVSKKLKDPHYRKLHGKSVVCTISEQMLNLLGNRNK
jgi:predicted restriction endonuclease